jgi:hypothetical protein
MPEARENRHNQSLPMRPSTSKDSKGINTLDDSVEYGTEEMLS